MRTRILAAFATFSIGAALVGALTFGGDAAADAPAPAPASTKVASLTPPAPNPPPAETQAAQPEAPKPKPKSHARKFLPEHHFGGY